MQQFLLAAETGSGKTLAYLLPIIDAIKRMENVERQNKESEEGRKKERSRNSIFELDPPPLTGGPDSTMGRPRAIILLPLSLIHISEPTRPY